MLNLYLERKKTITKLINKQSTITVDKLAHIQSKSATHKMLLVSNYTLQLQNVFNEREKKTDGGNAKKWD